MIPTEYVNVVRVRPDCLRVTYTRVRGMDFDTYTRDVADWPELFRVFPAAMLAIDTVHVRVSSDRCWEAIDNREVYSAVW